MLVVVGEALVIDAPGDPADPRQATVQPSGAPAIFAYVAGALGVPPVFVGGVGDDEDGELIVDTLTRAGVPSGPIVIERQRPTARASVRYAADGSRSFRFDVAGSAAVAVRPADLEDVSMPTSWLHVCGCSLLFGDPLAATVGEAVRLARRHDDGGLRVSVDPNLRAELPLTPTRAVQLRRLCRTADVVLPSEGELETLGLDADDLASRGAVVCTTRAERGADVVTGDGRVHVPAAPPPGAVVDPDGAGDTFAAAFVVATLDGQDPAEAAGTASAVAAQAVAVPGPMTVRPTPIRPRADPPG